MSLYTKLLAIHIDSSLAWGVQVSHGKKIVIYNLFLLKRIRHFLPKNTRILFALYGVIIQKKI